MKKLLTFLTLLTLFFGVGWAADVTDVLNRSTTGVTGSSYTNWSGKTSNSTAVYAGNSAGGNTSIQLRSNESTSGIVTTTSGGKVKSITVSWNGNTSNGRTLNIYGKNSAYSAASDLYGTNAGTLLGTIVYGVSTSLTVSGDYQYIGIRSNSGALYLTSVTIVWETGGSTPTTYSVNLNQTTGGTISASPTTAAEGATVTVTATPDTGYKLSTVTVTPDGGTAFAATVSGNTATFAMPGSDVEVDATFEQSATTQYKLVEQETDLASNAEYVLAGIKSSSYDALMGIVSSNLGTAIQTGFDYDSATKTITVEEGSGVTPLTLVKDNDGNWTFNNGSGYISHNGDKKIEVVSSITNNAKWIIDVNSLPSNNQLIQNVGSTNYYLQYNSSSPRFTDYSSNQSAVALFKKVANKTYDVTVTQGANGTITASPSGQKVVDAGDKITVTATPDPGYELDTWTITGAQETEPDANNQITATGDVTITASFKLAKNKVEYTIAPTNSGTVWLESGAPYDETLGYSTSEMGTTVTIKLVPYSGYEINTLTITDANGTTVSYTTGASDWSGNSYGTHYTFTMPATAVTIAATFKNGDIYILGTANDNAWAGNVGVPMTFNATANTYTARVYFKGDSDADDEVLGYGRFSFADRLGNADWSNMGKRFGANDGNNYDLSQHGWSGGWTDNNQSNPNAFMLPAGIYDITVNWGTGVVSAVKVNPTVSLDKAAGQLETGTTVNVVSNLTSLLQACKSGVSATLAYSTDNGTSYTDGNNFVVYSDLTAKGKATYGKIEAESDSYEYTVVTHYAVTATANPTAGGTVTVSPASALAGETVTITATPKSGYELTSITVNGEPLEAVEGVYSFTMPAQATEVIANFAIIDYTITPVTTNCSVDVASTAVYNSQVTFTVTPRSDKYEVSSVTVTYGDGRTKPVTDNGDGTYSFYMPDDNVTLTVICTRKSTGGNQFTLVKSQTDIVAGGEYVILNAATTQAMTKTSSNNYDAYSTQYNLDGEIVTLTEGSDVSILKFIDGSTTGTFKIQDGNLYLTAASKKLNATANGSDWTVTLGSDNNVTIQSGNWVIKNNANYFRCYDSSTGTLVKLYKRLPAGVSVEIDPTTGNVIGSQVVNVGSDTDGALVQYKVEKQNGSNWDVVTDWTEWTTYTEANGPVEFTITGNVGDVYQVTARAKEADQVVDPDEEEDFDEQTVQYTFVAPAAPTITPASCNISSETQNVTITSSYDNGTIEYSIDGGTTWNTYSAPFNVVLEGVGQSVTVQARVTVNGVTSEVATATYTRGVQPVVFSPASGGTYYDDQTCQMFSTTKGARIYYTTDGSDPVMNQGTTQLYTGEISMPATAEYTFKAIAYIGTTASAVTTANYNIRPRSEGTGYNDDYLLFNVAELNAMKDQFPEGTYQTTPSYTMVNPVQVVWMSTYKNVNNGYPEYCLIRDNTGYGMIYFGKNNSSHAGYTIFDMGDWIAGGYNGKVSLAYSQDHGQLDTHPELGASGSTGKKIYQWPYSAISNNIVLPEYLTIPQILASGTTGNPDYWGHYVHLRKNTVELIQSTDPGNYTTGQDKDGKWSGTITDEKGNKINYYDKFYLQIDKGWTIDNNMFTGHPNRTFDIYGFVACHLPAEIDYQIAPFAFAWIDKPVIDKETGIYTEAQTVTLSSPEDQTATIWYKTSDMDDYAVYTEPFEVNSTTTVEWYATKQSQYNDELESLRGSITMTFEEIAKPVITPESQVKAVGESVDASIAYEDGKTVPPIAVILYTTDGSDPKTSETAQEYTIGTTTLHFTTTTTVRAITRVGNLYSAEADAKTYTFVKSNGIEYTLIDDVTKLKENGVYVIVSQNYSEAMSTTQNVNNRGAAGVLFVEGTNKAKVYGNDDVAQFTLSVLTHDEDTSPERHFLMQTNNSNVNGYLYVGHDVNNSLMTEAEEDAMGNDVAVITIDANGRAHIHFNYAGGDNRYLQYWNRDRLFNTYKTEYDDRAVYIYGVEATPLATIEKEGVTTEGMNQYTIADELVVVWANADEGKLWCKDQGNVSIAKTEIKDGQVDYMKEVGQQHGEWDQSNWVVLQFPKPTTTENDPIKTLLNNAVGKYIEPATVTGYYIDDNNYTIQMAQAENYTLALKEGADTTKNVYCTANFLPDNLNINGQNGAAGIYHGDNRNYFFMNPKIQEVCSITFAEWIGENTFIVPVNDAQINGSFKVDWAYNAGGPQSPASNTAYRFVAAVQRPQGSTYLKAGQEDPIIVYPLDFTAESALPTAINTVEVGNGEIKSIKYVNVAGIVSDRPFQGVNIVVTEYTDGSRTTSKMLCK